MRIKVSFEMEINNDIIPEEEILGWLKFELGQHGSMKCENPLNGENMDAEWVDFERM